MTSGRRSFHDEVGLISIDGSNIDFREKSSILTDNNHYFKENQFVIKPYYHLINSTGQLGVKDKTLKGRIGQLLLKIIRFVMYYQEPTILPQGNGSLFE